MIAPAQYFEKELISTATPAPIMRGRNTPPYDCSPRSSSVFTHIDRSVKELKQEFPNIIFDEIAEDEDLYWEGDREEYEAMIGRGRELLAWLRARPETNIVVVRARVFKPKYLVRVSILLVTMMCDCSPHVSVTLREESEFETIVVMTSHRCIHSFVN